MSSPKSVMSGKSDVEVALDDQEKINEFARLNARLEEVKALLIKRKKDLSNLNDAIDEMMLQDDELPVPLMIGEAFIHYQHDDAHLTLEHLKDDTDLEVIALMKEQDDLRESMSKLKIDLYAKFGSSINLEAEEEV